MNRGFVILPRSFWDLEILNHSNKPFSKREAWLYLFSNMANGVARNGLDRGEFQASARYLARAFSWSVSHVHRFLGKLEQEGMIERFILEDKISNCYRITNFELYQNPGRPNPCRPKPKTRKSEYHEYLASREWAILKNKVRNRSGGICERCGTGEHDHTHHLTYERAGHELLTDLIGVCMDCHKYLSGKSDHDPAGTPHNANTTDQTGILPR